MARHIDPLETRYRELLYRVGFRDGEAAALCGVTRPAYRQWRVRQGLPSNPWRERVPKLPPRRGARCRVCGAFSGLPRLEGVPYVCTRCEHEARSRG